MLEATAGFRLGFMLGPLFPPRLIMGVGHVEMHAVFHVMTVTADVTDFEFHILAYYVSGTFQPGMQVRFRPSARLLCTHVLHSIELNDTFSRLEHRPCYDLKIDCGSLESVEFLHDLHLKDEDIELVSMPAE